jgi:erythromycin esterase
MRTTGTILCSLALTLAAPSERIGQGARSTECPLGGQSLPELGQLSIGAGRIEPGNVSCYSIRLAKGEFIRASLALPPADGSDLQYLRLRLFGPQSPEPAVVKWAWNGDGYQGQPPALLAYEAARSGRHVVELSIPRTNWSIPATYTLQIDERVPATERTTRRAALAADPRISSLRHEAVALRSLDPADEDFADLRFLRDQLAGVRVVLLGEGSPGHGGGSEQHAKTRRVKFLHKELGFDVLAIEAGLFGASEAWRGLQAGDEPQSAYLRGAYRNAGLSSHVQPLIAYLAATARTDRPLELTGFDSEFSGTAPRSTLLPRLRDVLDSRAIASPLRDAQSGASRLLASIIEGSFQRRRSEFLAAGQASDLPLTLRAAAVALDRADGGRDGIFWAQVLRSAANRAEQVLGQTPPGWTEGSVRDHHMADNLTWLVKTGYPGRRIIVWGHSDHLLRHPRLVTVGRLQGFAAGQGVWDAIGPESFVVGFAPYAGAFGWVVGTEGFEGFRHDITVDQHPSFEFEELMAAAGHWNAWINLRAAARARTWLGVRSSHARFTWRRNTPSGVS